MKKYFFGIGLIIIFLLLLSSPVVKIPVYNFDSDIFEYKYALVPPFLNRNQKILFVLNKLKLLSPEKTELDKNISFENPVFSGDRLSIDMIVSANNTSSFHETLTVRQIKEVIKVNFRTVNELKLNIFPEDSFKHLDTTKTFKIKNKGEK